MNETAVQQEVNTGAFALPTGELARITRLLVAKGGGTIPFKFLGFEALKDGTVVVEHLDETKSRAIHAMFSAQVTVPGKIATNDTARFLDYIDSALFSPDLPLQVEAVDGKIHLTNGSREVHMGAFGYSSVPRGTLKDAYGPAPNGAMVSGHPKHRPSGGTWEDWTKAGYVVFHTTPAELQRLLMAGTLAVKHGYRNAVYNFNAGQHGISVQVQEARDKTADVILYGCIEGTQLSSVTTWFSVRHDHLEPLWGSLSATKSKVVTLLHHPDDSSLNLIFAEPDQPAALRLGQKVLCFERQKAQRTA